ncbi:MAG: ABC transporter ATP-binding protein [bacterium]|nr:ABC transporter ATP-binding protein [bacterium]
MLELRGVDIRLGGFRIESLDLALEENEYFVLLGPSGVGKTVLLEIIAGLHQPTAGRILFAGEEITKQPPERRPFAIVYQDYALFPHLSVEANIGFGPKVQRVPGDEIERRCAELLHLLDITSLKQRRVATLSGGEQQRVALARALAIRPRLLLLDEPLSALDGNIRLRLRNELKRIHEGSNAVFLHVTHDKEEAMALGDRIGVMLGQRVHQVARPHELFHNPSDIEVTRFLNMTNVIAVDSVTDNVCRVGGAEIHAAGAVDSTSHIWIKPEEILLSKLPFDSSARNQFRGTVTGWEPVDRLLMVKMHCGKLQLSSLVTQASFDILGVDRGTELFVTFKSSAVHCF